MVSNLKCIKLMMTNRSISFQNSCVFETALSDFPKVTITVLWYYLPKLTPQIFKYRGYKNLTNEKFCSQITCRPIIIQSSLSKVFERCLYNQLYPFFYKILSTQQCGFSKGFSARHCIIGPLENWKQCSGKSVLVFCVLLTVIS